MEKRLAIAIALCVGFMLFWSWMFPTPKPEPQPGAETTATGAPGGPAATGGPATPQAPDGASPDATATGPSAGATLGSAPGTASGSAPATAPGAARPDLLPQGAAAGAAEETVLVETPLVAVRLTTKGAQVVSWVLKNYKDEKGEPLELVSPAAAKLGIRPLAVTLDDAEAAQRINGALYAVERRRPEDPGGATELVFTWSDGAGTSAAKRLRIPDDSYLDEVEVAVEVGGRPASPGILWGAGFLPETEETSEHMGVGTRAVVSHGANLEHRYESALEPGKPWGQEGALPWAGIENKYFAAIFVQKSQGLARARAEVRPIIEDGREHRHMVVSLTAPPGPLGLFVGPKANDVLSGLGYGLDRLLDFGFFAVVAKPLFLVLRWVQRYVGNWGLAIIVLTIVIRLLFFPFMHRSQLKMRVMQEKMKSLNPKLKALKERYQKLERKEAQKGGAAARQRIRQQMNEEMMALYKTEGINPFASMSGCIPLLAQMPILYAFYTILTISIELRHAPFMLWIRDLSLKDPYYVTPLLMGGTMLIQQVMTSSSIADVAQRRMMYIMPVMFTWFFLNLPSGLVLYWLVNNLIGIVQQYLVNKEADARQVAASAA